MKNRFIIVMIITFGMLHFSCKETTVEPTTPVNEISNPSFEVDGKPSIAGWSQSDTSFIKFSGDVPPGGGNWSVSIETIWGTSRIRTNIQPDNGTHRYYLSTWSKIQGVGGEIYLILNNTVRKKIFVADTIWNVYTIIDTISAKSGDTITIQLSGGFSQLRTGKTYFDLCTFQKLD